MKTQGMLNVPLAALLGLIWTEPAAATDSWPL